MNLGVEQFPEFFAALNGGHEPFSWQVRLLRRVLETGRWPDRIEAPTGAGKTAVIDVHVFAVAMMAADPSVRVPRRLSLVVDRRALVDSQFDRANSIADRLARAEWSPGDPLGSVAALLRKLRSNRSPGAGPLAVAMLRGGVVPSTRWRDDPTACAVICATPDMWGSRLLLRGYGTSRNARPREAGLLAYDTVVVVDEAHLARQLVTTARRIEALEGMAEETIGIPVLQVVETTATQPAADDGLSRSLSVIRVEHEDLSPPAPADKPLADRLLAPKPVRVIPTDWPAPKGAGRAGLASTMADAAEDLHDRFGPTVACVANTVAVAVAVATELKKRARVVEVLVGRMRQQEIQDLRSRRPGLFTSDRDPEVDFIVATQTVEVGIDADFSAMVTELAPGASLAQRAGRVNRLGRRGGTEICVIGPAVDVAVVPDAAPYRSGDLTSALEWLSRRAIDGAGLAPWSLVQDPPPEEGMRRMLLQRPEIWDAWLWARTSDDLATEPDLALWLDDDLEAERDVGVVVRQGLPLDNIDAIALLRATPPQAREAFPASIALVRMHLRPLPPADERTRAFRVRDDDIDAIDDPAEIRPGDMIVCGDDVPWFAHGIVVEPEMGAAGPTDVLEEDTGPGRLVLRIGPGMPLERAVGVEACGQLLTDLVGRAGGHARDGRERRSNLARVLDEFAMGHAEGPTKPVLWRVREAAKLLSGRLGDADIAFVPRLAGSDTRWVVITDTRRTNPEEELRQIWTGTDGTVSLAAHSAGVAGRAEEIAARVGLDSGLLSALATAGDLHDQGKRDARFQRMLAGGILADQILEPLAKSGARSRAEMRLARASSDLPTGWRHEQLSAGHAWRALEEEEEVGRVLVTRLVGTSHGYGRSGFPHAAGELIGASDELRSPCEELFDDAVWDELIERTHRHHGVWGCAYLEALLRAADCLVSGEGG